MNNNFISIIIPIRNEEKYIIRCLTSIQEQSYPKKNMEIILVDGMSEDNTKRLIEQHKHHMGFDVILLKNEMRIAPVAMNIGIHAAKGNIIIRLDAHSEYSNDYIEQCINTMNTVHADNVGGLALTKGEGKTGEAFAQVLSSKFGVGNSKFRTNGKSGYVDTVPFGTYRKETFQKYGYYDERLARNQDYELNYRIRKSGGTVYLNSDIKLYYLCKNSISDIAKQSFENGKWNVITMRLCPGSMGTRHFIPLLFVASIIFGVLFSIMYKPAIFLLAAEITLYSVLDFIFSLKKDNKLHKNHLIRKLWLFPVFHICYGIGSLMGIIKKVD